MTAIILPLQNSDFGPSFASQPNSALEEDEDFSSSNININNNNNDLLSSESFCMVDKDETMESLPDSGATTSTALPSDDDDDDEQDFEVEAEPPQQVQEEDQEETFEEAAADPELLFSSASSPSPIVGTARKQQPFGGLVNMGNTCYLNSALQMVASLDSFQRDLESVRPTKPSALRESILEVLRALQSGAEDRVRPDSFKTQIDERSPLFVGYRQQDAHEFLTTLLDLLDQDYKVPEEEEEETKQEDEKNEDFEMNEEPGDQSGSDDQSVAQEAQSEGTLSSPVKKQRLDDSSEDVDDVDYVDVAAEVSPIGKAPSFQQLEFEGIESLLHGENAGFNASSSSLGRQQPDEVKCKLVGGRMSTSGVSLSRMDDTPIDGDGSFSQAAVKPKNDEVCEEAEMDEAESKPSSPLETNFATKVRVCLTCDSCKYRRSHEETYWHLSLEIGPNCSTIEEGLRKFFQPETRSLKCEKCFCETAEQTMEITKLPRALLFHLKRFIVDVSPDYTSISYRKDQSPVKFEESLSVEESDVMDEGVLSEFVAADVSLPPTCSFSLTESSDSNKTFRYGIRSVVNHIGASASCGHYTADAKRQENNTTDREWFRFNDSIVSSLDAQQAVQESSRTAYMIMYELERC